MKGWFQVLGLNEPVRNRKMKVVHKNDDEVRSFPPPLSSSHKQLLHSTMSSDLLQALREAEVIPQVIPEEQAKGIKSEVRIIYPKVTVSRGEKPARADVLEIPEIEFPEAVRPQRSNLAFATETDLELNRCPIGSFRFIHYYLHGSRSSHERRTNPGTRKRSI